MNSENRALVTDELFRLRNDLVYIKISGILVIILSERREYTSKSKEKRRDVKHVTGCLKMPKNLPGDGTLRQLRGAG